MTLKKTFIAESPKHTDAGDSAVFCSLYIHIAVTHINRIIHLGMQLPHCLEHRIGRRLLPNSLCFILTYSYFYKVAKEMTTEISCCCIELITHHGRASTPVPQLPQHVHDAFIGFRAVHTMLHIVLAEIIQHQFSQLLGSVLWHGPLYKTPHTVAYKHTNMIDRMLGHIMQP